MFISKLGHSFYLADQHNRRVAQLVLQIKRYKNLRHLILDFNVNPFGS